MIIEIPCWVAHYNQLLYSALKFAEFNRIDLKVMLNKSLPVGGLILKHNNKSVFLDYSDDTAFVDNHDKYDFYFKRSLAKADFHTNIFPLNFQINFAYKPLLLLTKMQKSILFDRRSKVELIRAVDFLSLFTNDSHVSKKIDNFQKKSISKSSDGRVIFMSRLWDDGRANSPDEKQRRLAQNDFRVNACRIIRKEFPNAIVGLYPDSFAKKVAPDVLLNMEVTSKKNYLKTLKDCDIAIADDGLKDTPGWKIGEYVVAGKAIISTPINIEIENFREGVNYLSTGDRGNYEILPELINNLLVNKTYENVQKQNEIWYESNLEPVMYIQKIINIIGG